MNRPKERGMVLVIALTLSVLYFGLMELLLIDSSRALSEAQRFRARVVAATLAENAAELAAEQLVNRQGSAAPVKSEDFQGSMEGVLNLSGGGFEITGHGTSSGVITQEATVVLHGRVVDQSIKIDFANHTQ